MEKGCKQWCSGVGSGKKKDVSSKFDRGENIEILEPLVGGERREGRGTVVVDTSGVEEVLTREPPAVGPGRGPKGAPGRIGANLENSCGGGRYPLKGCIRKSSKGFGLNLKHRNERIPKRFR